MDGATACAQELVLAIFRLAVADSLAIAYGHDGPARFRRIARSNSDEATAFLVSSWADHLADISGFSGESVRLELAKHRVHLPCERNAPAGPQLRMVATMQGRGRAGLLPNSAGGSQS